MFLRFQATPGGKTGPSYWEGLTSVGLAGGGCFWAETQEEQQMDGIRVKNV